MFHRLWSAPPGLCYREQHRIINESSKTNTKKGGREQGGETHSTSDSPASLPTSSRWVSSCNKTKAPTEKSLNLTGAFLHKVPRRLPGSHFLSFILGFVLSWVKYLGQILMWRGVPSSSGCASAIAKLHVVRSLQSLSCFGAHRTEKAKSSSFNFDTGPHWFLTLASSSSPLRK